MYIGTLAKYLDYIDETPWLQALDSNRFWVDSPLLNQTYDHKHKALAFFVLMQAGRIGNASMFDMDTPEFDRAKCPSSFLADPRVLALISHWSDRHAQVYGPGFISKMGLYVFAPHGEVGYHVDGVVRLEGDQYDVSNRQEWDAALHLHASHRTILPLMVGAGSDFSVVGRHIRMTPGLWFEFSNVLPHAFVNSAEQHSVLLVTTYKPYANVIR